MILRILLILFLFSAKAFATDPPMQLYDEGVLQGTIFKINCVGTNITCTRNGTTGIITVSGSTPPTTGQLQFLGVDLQFNSNDLTFNP